MVTYADLVTLLLTFFVLLLSFSTLDNRKIKEALGSLRGAMGVLHKADQVVHGKKVIMPIKNLQPRVNRYKSEEVAERLNKQLREEGVRHKVGIRKTHEGVVLSLVDAVLFRPGSAELTDGGKEALHDVARLLNGFQSDIRVSGHTDNAPIPEKYRHIFPSNWELSTGRALAVMHHLTEGENMPDKPFSVAGYAGTKPIQSNLFSKGRAANRRVEITLLAEKKKGSSVPEENMDWEPVPNDDVLPVRAGEGDR